MLNKLGFSRITFIMMLGIFTAGTFALTEYAKAERHAHKHAGKARDVKKEAVSQKKWCDAHNKRDECHLQKKAAPACAMDEPEKQGWFSRTWCRVKGWFKRSPKVTQAALPDVDEARFKELVGTGKPVVVKFHATWCGICHKMQPIDDEVAGEHTDVTFVQVDVDKFKELANKQGASGVPTYVFYNKGGKQSTHGGSMTAKEFSKKVADLAK